VLCWLIGCLFLPPLVSAPPQRRRGGCHCRPCHARGGRRRSVCHQEQRSPWWRLFGPARGAVNSRWQAQRAGGRGTARSHTTNDRAIRARPFLPAHAGGAPPGRQAGSLARTNPPGHGATAPHARGLRAPSQAPHWRGGGAPSVPHAVSHAAVRIGRRCRNLPRAPCKAASADHAVGQQGSSVLWPQAAAGHARFVLSAAGARTPPAPRNACAAAAAANASASASTSEPPTPAASHAPSVRLGTDWLKRGTVSGRLTFGGRPLPERFPPRSSLHLLSPPPNLPPPLVGFHGASTCGTWGSPPLSAVRPICAPSLLLVRPALPAPSPLPPRLRGGCSGWSWRPQSPRCHCRRGRRRRGGGGIEHPRCRR